MKKEKKTPLGKICKQPRMFAIDGKLYRPVHYGKLKDIDQYDEKAQYKGKLFVNLLDYSVLHHEFDNAWYEGISTYYYDPVDRMNYLGFIPYQYLCVVEEVSE